MPFMGKNERLSLPMSEDLILTNTAYMFPSEMCCLNLRGRIKVTAFQRGQTVADMLRELLAGAFPAEGDAP